MQHSASDNRQMLDEDLQIVRATLATIVDEVRNFSGGAADAIKEALEKLDRAQREFSPSSEPE
jgi:hypothetical protein